MPTNTLLPNQQGQANKVGKANATPLLRLSCLGQLLLWFGAAVSIAEIATGAMLAPLGLKTGLCAIIIGHVIGAVILFPVGLIGAKTGLSSAASVRISLGKYGSFGFSILNALQLLGWTAIMTVYAADSLNIISSQLWGFTNNALWCAVIGMFICIWIILGMKNLARLNTIIVTALFAFALVLAAVAFRSTNGPQAQLEPMPFSRAVELSVAMCVSWLPLISDYTRQLKKPLGGTLSAVAGYFSGSVLMFAIGLGAALFAASSNVSQILLMAGLGLMALFIVVFSTVTTTFLDVYSAAMSMNNLYKKTNEKFTAALVCLAGTLLAIFAPIERYEDFLYLIGSVFAPLFSIMLVDYFIFNKKVANTRGLLNIKATLFWLAGFAAYRLLLPYNNFALGLTLPVMLGTGLTYALVSPFMQPTKPQPEQ